MLCSPVRRFRALFGIVVVVGCCIPAGALAQGIYIPSAGPVSRSMGGATTAVPLDGIGSLYWNPAVISGLPSSELGFGADLLSAVMELSSSSGPSAGATQRHTRLDVDSQYRVDPPRRQLEADVWSRDSFGRGLQDELRLQLHESNPHTAAQRCRPTLLRGAVCAALAGRVVPADRPARSRRRPDSDARRRSSPTRCCSSRQTPMAIRPGAARR